MHMNSGVRMSLLIACLFCVLPTAARAQVVPPPPPPPVVTAYAVAATTTRNTPVNIQFNGTTSRGSLTYSTTTDPISGTLGPIEGDTIVYTPSTGYVGTDTFVYQVFSTPTSQTATVTITILGPDTTAPIITAPATQYFSTTTVPAFPVLVAASSTDDTDPNPVITSDAPASFPVGTTTVTWTATDTSGNHASTTSDVGITLVPAWMITSDRSTALTTESFTATATTFDGTSSYIPAAGTVIGVVFSSSTTTVIATSTADAAGKATFAITTAGSYLIGIEADSYATTTPITITEPALPAPAPVPTPAPVGNGPPVANPAPSPIAPAAPIESTTTPSVPAATQVPTPIAGTLLPTAPRTTTAATTKIAVAKPEPPVAAEPTSEALPLDTQLAAAASASASATNSSPYEFLGLIIVLLALAGLAWQWKKRRERAQ